MGDSAFTNKGGRTRLKQCLGFDGDLRGIFLWRAQRFETHSDQHQAFHGSLAENQQ